VLSKLCIMKPQWRDWHVDSMVCRRFLQVLLRLYKHRQTDQRACTDNCSRPFLYKPRCLTKLLPCFDLLGEVMETRQIDT